MTRKPKIPPEEIEMKRHREQTAGVQAGIGAAYGRRRLERRDRRGCRGTGGRA